MQKAIVLICLCAIFLAASQPLYGQNDRTPTSTAELDLRAYEAQLDHDANLIGSIKSEPTQIRRFRNSLPSAWSVRVDDTLVRVPTEWLDSALGNLETHPEKASLLSRDIELRLVAMRQSAVALEESSPDVAVSVAQERLHKIFEQREFRGLHGPSELELLEARIGRWIAAQIDRLLRHIHIRAKTGDFLAWMVIALAFVALCYWVFRSLSRRRSRVSELPASDRTAPSDSRLWVEDALAAAESGDYREAVHCSYWAAVARFEDLGLLARDRARTPRESLRLLDLHPDKQKPLKDLTRHFELIWYGYRPVSATDWYGARAQLEKMGCLSPSTAPTASS
jgi:hypothetical protein